MDGISCSNVSCLLRWYRTCSRIPVSQKRQYYSPTMSSSRKNDESTPNRIAMRVLLENMILRNPLGFFAFTRAAQQASNEGAVQEVMLNRLLFERNVWRWTGSGNRIPSCNSVEGGVWRGRDDGIWRVALGMALASRRTVQVAYVRIGSRESFRGACALRVAN